MQHSSRNTFENLVKSKRPSSLSVLDDAKMTSYPFMIAHIHAIPDLDFSVAMGSSIVSLLELMGVIRTTVAHNYYNLFKRCLSEPTDYRRVTNFDCNYYLKLSMEELCAQSLRLSVQTSGSYWSLGHFAVKAIIDIWHDCPSSLTTENPTQQPPNITGPPLEAQALSFGKVKESSLAKTGQHQRQVVTNQP